MAYEMAYRMGEFFIDYTFDREFGSRIDKELKKTQIFKVLMHRTMSSQKMK